VKKGARYKYNAFLNQLLNLDSGGGDLKREKPTKLKMEGGVSVRILNLQP
jgi:hypothetical protein